MWAAKIGAKIGRPYDSLPLMPMKEVLTKKFWKDVRKTFEDARDGTALKAGDSPVPPPALLVNRQESGADGQQSVDLPDSDQRGHAADE